MSHTYKMKSTLIFFCAFTGVALAQHHCTKYEDCAHLACHNTGYVCKDQVCSCIPWCQNPLECACPLDTHFSVQCNWGGCECRDSNGLLTLKHCLQRSDCHSVTCPPNTTRHCINYRCECQHAGVVQCGVLAVWSR